MSKKLSLRSAINGDFFEVPNRAIYGEECRTGLQSDSKLFYTHIRDVFKLYAYEIEDDIFEIIHVSTDEHEDIYCKIEDIDIEFLLKISESRVPMLLKELESLDLISNIKNSEGFNIIYFKE